jgi:two-component system, NarL family, invasion response regulator UvrY
MTTLLMVDDHALVRRGLRAIVEEDLPNVSVEEAGTAREGLEALRQHVADAVVLDLGLPDRTGLDLLKRIHQEWPRLPVLILSMYDEEQYGLRAMRAGASGYLSKGSAPEKLVFALKKILHGGRYVSANLGERLAAHVSGALHDEPHQALSDREYQVFRLIASGKSVSEIAGELSLSVKTVSTHRARILQKMGLKHNADLTHYAMSKGLVE